MFKILVIVATTLSISECAFVFRQLFDKVSSTYTYLLGDSISNEAILIDPVFELVDRDLKMIDELDLNLKFVLNTHCHADHITASGLIKQRLPSVQSAIGSYDDVVSDIKLKEDDTIQFGDLFIKTIETEGHTSGCVSYLFQYDGINMVFTGDALFVRGCGRTDFQGGNASRLYDNIRNKVFTLPDSTMIYPGHDYQGRLCTTVGEEKKYNPRLKVTKTRDEFTSIMNTLNLPLPAKIGFALPLNRLDGSPAVVKKSMDKLKQTQSQTLKAKY